MSQRARTRHHKFPVLIAVCTVFAACGALVSLSCASGEPVTVSALSGGRPLHRIDARARIRDLDACVRYIGNELDMAVIEKRQGDAGERVYHMKTVRDEPVWLVITSAHGWDNERALADLSCSATVGRFGDAAREREVVETLKRRLEELRERDPE